MSSMYPCDLVASSMLSCMWSRVESLGVGLGSIMHPGGSVDVARAVARQCVNARTRRIDQRARRIDQWVANDASRMPGSHCRLVPAWRWKSSGPGWPLAASRVARQSSPPMDACCVPVTIVPMIRPDRSRAGRNRPSNIPVWPTPSLTRWRWSPPSLTKPP